MAWEVVAGCACCVRFVGISHPNLQLKTQKITKCLKQLDFPWESIKSMGFGSGLIEVETVRVTWDGQMWGVPKQHIQI